MVDNQHALLTDFSTIFDRECRVHSRLGVDLELPSSNSDNMFAAPPELRATRDRVAQILKNKSEMCPRSDRSTAKQSSHNR